MIAVRKYSDRKLLPSLRRLFCPRLVDLKIGLACCKLEKVYNFTGLKRIPYQLCLANLKG